MSATFTSDDLGEIIDWYAGEVDVHLSAEASPPVMPPALRLENHGVGPVRIARSHVPAELSLVTGRSAVYALATVHAGALRVTEAAREWTLTPSVAGLYRPADVPRRNRVAARTDMTYLQIPTRDLERHLENLIGEYVHGPIDFTPELSLRGRPAWLRMFQAFTDAFDDRHSVVHRPLVARPLFEALMTALLYTADHPYRESLLRPEAPAKPRFVREAVDAMRAEPEHPYTVALLARIAGVSVRSLQHGFRGHLGMSPLAYLRRVRLDRVHDQLRSGDGVTVAEAAHRWGFTHLGRFAHEYASVYGETPSTTARDFRPVRDPADR
ncbi:AraC family transcriptional regulator [Actinoplanes sp. LDG1-06]|uniref:AraC family transcriptional regulator n=1 Tax=Paractinoplanes ovalisporus TaxID=2810368 RepID=A0ABS2ALZ7_9ACTN|nr:helix-turn-helix transcriptional regulator [Actinoplanes ovalisporus]MBM2620845.1 AraC family transcriptional regulator [Actinoplanes ovalisporus]